jgi:hypothetical protein
MEDLGALRRIMIEIDYEETKPSKTIVNLASMRGNQLIFVENLCDESLTGPQSNKISS